MKRPGIVLSVSLSLMPLILVLDWLSGQPVQVQSAVLTVCANGCDYSSIQSAIDAAAPGDTVAVASGDYTESLTLSKTVSLIGANAADTIVHALPDNRVLTVTGETITPSVVISGLTLMGGVSAAGGGLMIENLAQPHVENLVLTQNHALNGGGLHVASGQPQTFANVNLIANSADNEGGGGYLGDPVTLIGGQISDNNTSSGVWGAWGGGLYSADYLTLSGTLISHNDAYKASWQCPRPHYCTERGTGGGVWANYPITIINSRFEGNTAYEQGSALSARSGGTIVNSLFVCNSGDGLYAIGNLDVLNTTIACPTATVTRALNIQNQGHITNTIISGAVIGVETQGTVWEDYNLYADVSTPLSGTIHQGGHSLQGAPLFVNAAAGDYHLTVQSAALNSGINTDLTVDFEGDPRPSGASADIGYDEFLLPFASYLPLIQRSGVYHQIIVKSTGHCLDVQGASMEEAAPAITYPCNHQDNQTWVSAPFSPETSYYDFNAKHSQQCLDVLAASLANGAAVIQWPCHQSDNQLWLLESVGNNYYRVRARHSNKCLDANGPLTQAGYVSVVQNSCQNTNSQLWKFEPQP